MVQAEDEAKAAAEVAEEARIPAARGRVAGGKASRIKADDLAQTPKYMESKEVSICLVMTDRVR